MDLLNGICIVPLPCLTHSGMFQFQSHHDPVYSAVLQKERARPGGQLLEYFSLPRNVLKKKEIKIPAILFPEWPQIIWFPALMVG